MCTDLVTECFSEVFSIGPFYTWPGLVIVLDGLPPPPLHMTALREVGTECVYIWLNIN